MPPLLLQRVTSSPKLPRSAISVLSSGPTPTSIGLTICQLTMLLSLPRCRPFARLLSSAYLGLRSVNSSLAAPVMAISRNTIFVSPIRTPSSTATAALQKRRPTSGTAHFHGRASLILTLRLLKDFPSFSHLTTAPAALPPGLKTHSSTPSALLFDPRLTHPRLGGLVRLSVQTFLSLFGLSPRLGSFFWSRRPSLGLISVIS